MGDFGNLFDPKVPSATGQQEKWGPYDWEKPSLAVVAIRSHQGCILWYAGAHISYEIEEGGLDELGDLGLDDAPEGISVWEGTYVTVPSGGWEEQEFTSDPRGEFRPPTPEEWQAIQENRCPWNKNDWLKE